MRLGGRRRIPTLIDAVVHAVAFFIAWWLTMIIAAITSGLRGGVIATRAMLEFAQERGWSTLKEADSMLDEIAGMGIAALGIFFQLSYGFSTPLLLRICLLPLEIVEWWARWQVTFG